MKFPNWLKITWWASLIGLITWFLFNRYPAFAAGHAVTADMVAFIVWVALLLAPLFGEISLLGITLKQATEDLKCFVTSQVTDIKGEIRNAVDVRTIVSPQFHVPYPPSDSMLPQLENLIKTTVANALASHGGEVQSDKQAPNVPEGVSFLFSIRYNIEKELLRILRRRDPENISRSPISVLHMLRPLVDDGIIEPSMLIAVRDVYAVCSPAIHGLSVTDTQISFVKDVGPELVAALKSIP